MKVCQYDRYGVCIRCRRPTKWPKAARNCIAGAGDAVELALSVVGITKARAQAVANAVGFEDCGCVERQQQLNEFGYRLGIGTPPAISGPPAAQ